MLQTGLSHGVAIIPNAPKERYSDPANGAHFKFEDMCTRLDKILKKRSIEERQPTKKRSSNEVKEEAIDQAYAGKVPVLPKESVKR